MYRQKAGSYARCRTGGSSLVPYGFFGLGW